MRLKVVEEFNGMPKSSEKVYGIEHYYRVAFPNEAATLENREKIEILDLSDNPEYNPASQLDIRRRSIEFRYLNHYITISLYLGISITISLYPYIFSFSSSIDSSS